MEQRAPERVRVLPLDVTDATAAERAVRAAVDTFGRINVLVNNAGYGKIGSIEDTSLEEFRAQIETNLFGVVNVTKAAISQMRERRSGHIIQISSVGDRVNYYITAGKGPSYDRARLASNWNPLSRDEDVRYYLRQLEDVAKLFDEFTPGRSRQGILL